MGRPWYSASASSDSEAGKLQCAVTCILLLLLALSRLSILHAKPIFLCLLYSLVDKYNDMQYADRLLCPWIQHLLHQALPFQPLAGSARKIIQSLVTPTLTALLCHLQELAQHPLLNLQMESLVLRMRSASRTLESLEIVERVTPVDW